jgi:RNA polymerase sigma-70 factor (ECF subfamily)
MEEQATIRRLNTFPVGNAINKQMMGESDARLVLRARAGDRSAAETLARRYLAACRAIALAMMGNVSDAEDVCQDAFVAAMRDLGDCRDPSRFAAWLVRIVRNRALDALRHQRLHKDVLPADASLHQEPAQLRSAVRSELRQKLMDALQDLPEAQRIAVILHDAEGWKHREIAKILDIPHGTVRSHVHHARARLRELLQSYQEDDT